MNEELDSLEKKILEAFNKLKKLKKNNLQTKRNDLKFDEYSILHLLYNLTREENEHKKGVKTSTLSDETHLAKPEITNIINRLEKEGYVTRTHSKDDRRVVRVNLTEKATTMIALKDDEFAKEIRSLIKFIGVEKTKHLIEIVNTIFEYMKQRNIEEEKTVD